MRGRPDCAIGAKAAGAGVFLEGQFVVIVLPVRYLTDAA
jgi:hypothetical protein